MADTGEIRRIARELPRRREVDAALLTVVCAAFIAVGLWVLLIADPDRFPVERGRVVLTMAAAAAISVAVLGATYALNRANQRRFDAAMKKMDRTRCGCDGGVDRRRPLVEANGRAVSPSEYYKIYSDAMKDLGDLSPGDGTPAT